MINLCKKQQGLSTQTVILDTSRLVTHGALGLKKVGSNKGHDSLNVQYSCVVVGCHLRRKVFECAVSHEPHNPKVGGSNPPPATNLSVRNRQTFYRRFVDSSVRQPCSIGPRVRKIVSGHQQDLPDATLFCGGLSLGGFTEWQFLADGDY